MKCTGHFLDTASEPVNNKNFCEFNLVGKSATPDASSQSVEPAWCDLWYSDNNDNVITLKCMSIYYNHQSI